MDGGIVVGFPLFDGERLCQAEMHLCPDDKERFQRARDGRSYCDKLFVFVFQ